MDFRSMLKKKKYSKVKMNKYWHGVNSILGFVKTLKCTEGYQDNMWQATR